MWDSWPSASAQSLHESRHSEGNPLMPSIPKAPLPKRRFALDNAGASGFASQGLISKAPSLYAAISLRNQAQEWQPECARKLVRDLVA